MSVLIKSTEFPKNCAECWALDEYGDYPVCRITKEQRGYTFRTREQRMERCPLFEVPPHGRLIDADADQLKDEIWKLRAFKTRSDVQELIDSAPTVIPAEEADNG